MFQRIGPKAFKKDLNNIIALCDYLGSPETKFKSVHIAGTNGKGSVSHMLAGVCQHAGLKTGLYTSPHYRDFRERIKINGNLMPQKSVVRFVSEHRAFIEQIKPSFFEITVAMAFDHFAREQVDIAIVEVGLGGRLDSTNVLSPQLCVITNIGMDHMNFLGNTLELIAGEKAGIIKNNTPVVIGKTQPETEPVFRQKAGEMNAPIYFADQISQIQPTGKGNLEQTEYTLYKNDQNLGHFISDVSGPFQAENLNTAYAALEFLRQIPGSGIAESKEELLPLFKGGVQKLRRETRYLGRWQLLSKRPTVVADSAHNREGLALLMDGIKSIDYNRLHLVMGFVSDKDFDKTFPLLPVDANYYFAAAQVPRALNEKDLKKRAGEYGIQGRAYSSVKNALKAAKRKATEDDLIVVCGSIFVVAEVV